MSNVSRNFFIYSALPTQIFLDLLYVVIAWSLDQHKKKQSFVSVVFFPPLPISHLILLSYNVIYDTLTRQVVELNSIQVDDVAYDII